MMRTLRDMNMSKFVAEDVPLFLSLIEDLFPGMKAERNAFDNVTAALIKVRNGGLHSGRWCTPVCQRSIASHCTISSWQASAPFELNFSFRTSAALPVAGSMQM